ncbi:unnamed protein product [Boreogadus saida]
MDSPALNATLPALNNSSVFDCPKLLEGFWFFFCIVLFLLGFPLSIWVLWDLVDKHYRGGQPWTPNTVFTLNVTVMDLVFLAYLPVEVLNDALIYNKILRKISFATFSLNLDGRPLLTACMCLDCYMAVHHPLRYRSQTLSSRVIITAVIWLASLMNGAAFIMNEELLSAVGMWWPFLSSAAVILYCDCCLLWTLSSSRTSRGEPHQLKKRALNIISMSLLVTVANYLPAMIMILFGRYYLSEENYFCHINYLALILLASTSVFMPALYLMKVGKLNFATIFKPLSKAMELITTPLVLDMDSPALNATLPALNISSVIDCPKLLEGFWAFFSTLVFLLGFPLSIWVLWDLVDKHYRGGQPWTPNTVFTLNVTVMDLVFLAYMPVNVVNIILIENTILLNIGFVTFSLNLTGRPLLMACMCLDCYMAVHHPLRYHSQTLSSRVIITAVIWLASLVNGAAFIMNKELIEAPGMWWPFLSSAAVILYCDCCLLWTLSSSRKSRGEPHRLKKRALHIVSTSLLVTIVIYLPTMIMILFGRYFVGSKGNYFCLIVLPALLPLELTSVFMPALYLMKVGKLNFATIFKPLSKAMELITTPV